MELDAAIDSFLSKVTYVEPGQQGHLAGRNRELSEHPLFDAEFYDRVAKVRQAAELEVKCIESGERRFYAVLGVTAVLFIVCFVLSLKFGGSSLSMFGKTGIFATIVGIFGLYLDHERRRSAASKGRAEQAGLLASSLAVIRDPGDIVRGVSVAKELRKKARPSRPSTRRI
jgi:hypothetical protein